MPKAPTVQLEKHRDENPAYAIDFSTYLATGEVLNGTPTVEVELLVSGVWVDKSSEFVITNVAYSGDSLNFQLGLAASAADQLASEDYRVKATVFTDAGQTRVSDNPLWVIL